MLTIDKHIIEALHESSLGKEALFICQQLQEAGFEAFIVGGAVRDLLQGKLSNDYDITTSATPSAVLALFNNAKEDSNSLGTVYVSSKLIEVTTFRKESKDTNGRHPDAVEFTTKEIDAARRDFTINAIYFDVISGELFDPFNGVHDLSQGLLKFIGNPLERIAHDPLRSLRAIRQRAQLQLQYHPDTWRGLQQRASLTTALSGTRVLQELEKILLSQDSKRALEDLWELGIMEHIIPELFACKGIAQPAKYHKEGDVWDHLLQCVSASTQEHMIDVRLAALFHDVAKPITYSDEGDRIHYDDHASASGGMALDIFKRLQMPNARAQKFHLLITHHMMMGSFLEMNDKRKSHWYHHEWFNELLQLFWLDIAGTTPSNFTLYNSITADYHHFLDTHPKPIKPLLNGEEVMDILNMTPGKQVGEVLDKLHEAQMNKKVNYRDEAVIFVKNIID